MEKKKLGLKDASIAFLVAFITSQLAIVLGELVVSFILAMFKMTSGEITEFFNGAVGYCFNAIFQCFAFVGVFVFYCKKSTLKDECVKSKPRISSWIMYIVIGIITMFALTNFINQYTFTLNLNDIPTTVVSYSLDNTLNYIISLFSLAVLPAIGEELLFRGVILNGLKAKNKLFAIILSSVMFTIFHFSLSQLYYPLLFGLILGISYVCTENIFVPITIHFVNNALNLTLQHFVHSSSFFPSTLNTILMIVGVIIYLGILAFLLWKLYKKEKLEKENLATSQENLQNNKENKQKIDNNSNKIKQKTNYSLTGLIRSKKFGFYCPLVIMGILYIIIAILGA